MFEAKGKYNTTYGKTNGWFTSEGYSDFVCKAEVDEMFLTQII